MNLLSLFPTLLELSGLPAEPHHDGPSLVPLLRNSESVWPHTSVTHLGKPQNYGLSSDRWRYIHYADGGEELYDIETDPFEWTNLASKKNYQVKLNELRSLAPQKFAAKVGATPEPAPNLVWKSASRNNAPPSRPQGGAVSIEFFNNSRLPIKMFVLDQRGQPSFSAIIHGGRKHIEKTRQGIVYQICDGSGYQRGFFRVGDRDAKAVIPPEASAQQKR